MSKTKKLIVGGGKPEPRNAKIYRAIIMKYGSGIFGSPKPIEIEIDIEP